MEKRNAFVTSLPQILLQSSLPPTAHKEQRHLLGFRGLLAIQSFTWTFLQTFAPATVRSIPNGPSPQYETTLRSIFSVMLWNESLIYSAIILVSARTVCISFIHNSTRTAVASAVFRRGLRLWFPIAVALAIVKIITSTLGTAYIDQFKTATGNASFATPYTMPNALAYFNSVFNLFWTTRDFTAQSGNTAFPSQTLWVVNVVYSQSYTVYLTMIIIPYTRTSWRMQAYIAFIVTAWWVQSWAWYSITGLLLADCTANMSYRERAIKGINVWKTDWRCPTCIPCFALMAAGLSMKYLWMDWRPDLEGAELKYHSGLYSAGVSMQDGKSDGLARDDDYLVLLGFFLLLEYSSVLQRVLGNRFFVYLARRSLSWFLVQSVVVYTVGIKLFMHLSMRKHWSIEASRILCLLVCVITVAVGGELFYRLVDHPSKAFAHVVFDWIRR